ncbi:STAS/SEC14 domain-containing protein [Nisaea acidiphila]|uniref:STAS/SEC14 domain-containing protein n=1 Tax=Nisaea acidiphila TaxID=1862145 RepID=A0A9J7AZI5_9PROT|nr:STAS/SEC14 domain-containing protein [Nisaea acidiphila]UUX51833.1 STAS/SEC14 domain-containing protein [Nisaea acidiphila]
MISITKPAPNRIDMEFKGESIDEETMRSAIEQLIELAKDIEHGRLLYRLHHFPWPSLAAVGVKLGHLPELFKMLGRFDRCAVLSDESWLRTASDIEGALIPGLEIKGFRLDEAAEAETWLASED